MKNDLYINGKNAFDTWGVFLEDGSEEALLKPADPKGYARNNMRSQSGVQVFVQNPQPDERDIILTLCVTAISRTDYLAKYQSFIDEISNGWVLLDYKPLKTTYKLIATGFQSLSYSERLGRLSVRFNEPNVKERV